MRVTKEPEVRKQEILDTALKLFGENGYEKTSITARLHQPLKILYHCRIPHQSDNNPPTSYL